MAGGSEIFLHFYHENARGISYLSRSGGSEFIRIAGSVQRSVQTYILNAIESPRYHIIYLLVRKTFTSGPTGTSRYHLFIF